MSRHGIAPSAPPPETGGPPEAGGHPEDGGPTDASAIIRQESLFGRLPLLPGEREYGALGAHATCFAYAVAFVAFGQASKTASS